MLSIILNIIGLLCIIISLILINNSSKEGKELYERMTLIHSEVKYYSKTMENILNSFDDLIENSLNKLETYQKEDLKVVDVEEFKKGKYGQYGPLEKNQKNLLDKPKEQSNSNKEMFKKISEFKKEGLSNEEIAKKLNKGVREVDIIIKMWSNNI